MGRSSASPAVWRRRVIAMLESGLTAREWAARKRVPYQQLTARVRLLFEREPELFAMTGRLCPCPLMARIIHYRDPGVREYLKHVWFEFGKAAGGDPGGRQQIDCLCSVRAHLGPDSTPADIGLGLLRAIKASTRKAAVLKAAVLAAVSSGVHDGDPFFDWAVGCEQRIRACDTAGGKLRDLIEDGLYRRTRLVRCHSNSAGILTAATLITFDASGEFCIGLLDGFMARRGDCYLCDDKPFFAHFAESLGFEPESLDDFTAETFGRQVAWFAENLPDGRSTCALRLARLFYSYVVDLLPADQQAFTFGTGLPRRAFSHIRIATMWRRGYRAVVYEPLDPAPRFAKWLLYPNASEIAKAHYSEGQPSAVDCSYGDPRLERLLIEWLWEGGLSSKAVRIAPPVVKVLLDAVVERGVSVIRGGEPRRLVDSRCISAALRTLAETNQAKTIRSLTATLTSFLRYAEGRGALEVEAACYLLLQGAEKSSARGRRSKPAPVPAENLAALAGELERMGERSVGDELTYIAYITQALTPLRRGEVFALRLGDLDASGRRDFKAVSVCRKSGGHAREIVEVPEEVHRLLKTAVELTAPARSRADESIADRVFLVDRPGGMVSVLPKATYDGRLASACRRLGIPAISSSDVRRSYETTVIMEGAKRNWSRMMLRKVTGHASVKSDEPYITLDIMSPETRRYLEGAFVVEIGNPRIRGQVLPDDEVADDPAALVEGGAGVCRNEECAILGTLPCLECKGFATAPRFVPEMLEAVAVLDRQIAQAPAHQREHLLKAKKHYLAYLGVMIDMGRRQR